MPTPLRYIPEDAKLWKDKQGRPIAVVEITIRCLLGMYLLKPTPRNTSLIKGVIGRAQKRLDFELFGYAYLSNHGSLLAGVRSAEHLAAAMEYIHGNIAREVGRQENSDWQGRFWSRRGRPILVLSDEDLVNRMRYLLSNSTKENLVKHPTQWPGAHCARALCFGETDHGIWVDRTKLSRLRRKRGATNNAREQDVESLYELKIAKLPCWQDLSDEEYRMRIKDLCREIAEDAAEERKRTGASVLGVKKVLRFSPHHQPESVDKSPAPAVHCHERSVRQRFIDAYRSFVNAYQQGRDSMNQSIASFNFPDGGIPPGVRFSPDTS